MTTMIDRWHDAYHADAPDYINCPYCQDELMESALPMPVIEITGEIDWGVWIEETYDPDNARLEDSEI